MLIQIIIAALFIFKFAIREVRQMIEAGIASYIFDIWNWGDLLSIMLNTYYLIALIRGYLAHDDNKMSYGTKCDLRTTAGFSVVFMFFKMFYWMKIYHITGYFLA